jgi:hypothetical protein
MQVNPDYNIQRLSFGPVWTSSAPQEVLQFKLEGQEVAATSNAELA